MTAVAARTVQMTDYAGMASFAEVSEVTARQWLAILEKSGLVYQLKPYTPGVLKRAVKVPKLRGFAVI